MFNRINIFLIVFFLIFFNTFAFADVKTEVYSELKCCASCKDEFSVCSCSEAREMKAYIEPFLDSGSNKEQILIAVAKKFSLDKIMDRELRNEIEKKLIDLAGNKRPEIFIEPLHYDLGKVSKSRGKLELVVELENKGNETLVITDLKTTCGCTVVKLKTKESTSPTFSTKGSPSNWKVDLSQKEKAELIIVTDLDHAHVHLGRMVRTVEIRSNDPVYPVTTVEFQADIVK